MSLTRIEISRTALLENLKQFQKLAGKSKLMAVVKANAYGHGSDLVAQTVVDQVDWFGVAGIEEAIALRDQGINKPILVLSFYEEDLIEQALRKNISFAVYEEYQLAQLQASAEKLGLKAKVHIKIDTGTSRLGVLPAGTEVFLDKVRLNKNLQTEGVFSHYAASEENAKFTRQQTADFELLVKQLIKTGQEIPYVHIACSAALIGFDMSNTNLARVGIGLYGLWPSQLLKAKFGKKLAFKPALELKTKIIQIKQLPKGATVGYGLTYKTPKPMSLAILPVGYYDGYDRKLSNKGEVLVGGLKCPVRGRICMNLMMIDVSKVPDAKVGDEAVLIGRQNDQEITADDLAKHIGTINYEVVTRLNPNINRELVA